MSLSKRAMDFEEFRIKVKSHLGFDLTSYKPAQLQRRLESFMARKRVSGYEEYYRLLSRDANLLEELVNYLTINVTEFFRDISAWQRLEREILPRLAAEYKPLRIWSAACSNGAEPYSLAIMLKELGINGRSIEATDINEEVLQLAAAGRYPLSLCRNISASRMQRYFTQSGDTAVVIPEIRRMVNFRRHDLLKDAISQGYHLIVCRNVQIYFTREAQLRLNERLVKALVNGGVLFIGASESILDYKPLSLERLAPCFYRKNIVLTTLS
ncbi:CheR family methyltransferase [Desulforudis sp. 1088]|uniref:CheR family methyltransferase n=1 Tax=unclassified Candidatus Desulforudis TaxID=2635950 RepID=UPI003CE5B517